MANIFKKEICGIQGVPANKLPRHVAIILDGNNRWAKSKRLPGLSGHKAGVERVREVVEACGEWGIEVLTLFAFSSENWNRPSREVNGLMGLFLRALRRETKKLKRNRIRLKIIGDITRFSPAIQKHIRDAEAFTADDATVTLVIAANYGGRWDITHATRLVAEKVANGDLAPSDVTESLIEQHLSTSEFPGSIDSYQW